MRTWIAFLVPFTFLAGILFWRVQSEESQLRYYAPEEYVRRSNALIERGYLEAVCEGTEIRIEERFGEGAEVDETWYRNSYLVRDVRRFNGDFDRWGWIFFVDDTCNLLGVNPSVHAIRLPFAGDDRWEGRLLYSGPGSDAVLRSSRRTLALVAPEKPVRTDEQTRTLVGGSDDIHGSVILSHYAGGSAQPAVRFYTVGQDVVLQNRSKGPEARGQSWLMGYLVPAGRIARLESGDWLRLRASSPRLSEESMVYLEGEVRPVGSRLRLQNGKARRIVEDDHLGWFPDPQRDASIPFLQVVGQRIESALGVVPPEQFDEGLKKLDVRLAIDRDLHREVNRVFHAWAKEEAKERELPEMIAAVTVMDGRTGALLAAATFPHPEDVAEASAAEDRTRYRRLLNQNFVRHPIGSAGKPFYFAAAAQAQPRLMSLEIAGHTPEKRHRELLHCLLPSGYQLLEGHYDERIDFETALETSCNKYTVEFMTLALAVDPDAPSGQTVRTDPRVDWPRKGGSGIWIDGRELRGAPDLGRYFQGPRDLEPEELGRDPEHGAARVCGSIDRLEHVLFREPLEHITGAATYHGLAPVRPPVDRFYGSYVTHRYDLRSLGVLPAYLAERAGAGGEDFTYPMAAALQGVAPERVDLAFNTVTDLRQDLVSLLLGGANSTWTNVQLAEALSRMVTGREVRAGLMEEVRPGLLGEKGMKRPVDFPPLEFDPQVRERVLEGMRRVISGGRGTARPLRAVLETLRKAHPEDRILAFAKTGSPILLRAVPYRSAEALRALVREGDLAVRGGQVVVRGEGGDVVYRRSGQTGRQAFIRALGEALVSNRFTNRRARILLRLLDEMHDPEAPLVWNSPVDVPETIDGPLYRVGDQLRLEESDPLFTQQLLREQGGVFMLTIVQLPPSVPGSSRKVPTVQELSHPDARVLTIVMRLHAKEDSGLAVEATGHLLRQIDLLDRLGAYREGKASAAIP